MYMYTLKREQTLPAPRSTIFPFFSNPANLERITPDYLSFQLETAVPVDMSEGQVLSYSLSLHGIPFSWKSRVEVWEPPERFVDVQLQGPYRSWRHEHVFYESSGNTRIVDEVQYEVPGWFLSPLIHWLFVRNDVEEIFSYRQQKMEELFGNDRGEQTE